MQLAQFLARLMGWEKEEALALPQAHVFRLVEVHQVGNRWSKRILDQADGKLIAEIVERLYREELEQGGWLVGIGLWKERYAQELVQAMGEMVASGHLYLVPCVARGPSTSLRTGPAWSHQKCMHRDAPTSLSSPSASP